MKQRIYLYLSVALILVWITLIDSGSAQCSCYTFDGQPLRSWSNAHSLCQTNNGELVSMETVEEWEFIKTQIQSKATDGEPEWWIGLVRRDGEWRWLSNHTLRYDKWQAGKPTTGAQKNHVRIAKNYPQGTHGLLSNIRQDLERGTICEYKEQECISSLRRVQWCYPTTNTPSRSTTMISSTSFNPSTSTSITTTDIESSQASTHSTSNFKDAKQSFPTEIVASVIGVLALLCVCLLISVCIWKQRKKEERKPRRNSHLGKHARVPVKLEHSPSTNDANDLIDATDVINMTGQTNSCSTFSVVNDNALQPEPAYASIDKQEADVACLNATDGMNKDPVPLYASLDKSKKFDHHENINQLQLSDLSYAKLNDAQKTVNQNSYHGNQDPAKRYANDEIEVQQTSKDEKNPQENEETSPEVDSSACVYATVDKSSKTDAKPNDRLVYAQLAEFKNEQQTTTKRPSPYKPTEYATILTPIKLSKSKEDISQV